MDLIRNAAMAVGILFCLGLIAGQFVGGGSDDDANIDAAERDAAVERIQPVATVKVAGDSAPAAEAPAPTAAPAAPAAAATPEKASAPQAPAETAAAASGNGESYYKQTCFACHDTGVAEAPKLGDVAAWAPRLATGVEALVANAINGKGAMPPKGGNMGMSDEHVREVVVYMMEKSQ